MGFMLGIAMVWLSGLLIGFSRGIQRRPHIAPLVLLAALTLPAHVHQSLRSTECRASPRLDSDDNIRDVAELMQSMGHQRK